MREIDLIKEFRQRWINGEPYKKLDHTDFIVWKCALLIELAELFCDADYVMDLKNNTIDFAFGDVNIERIDEILDQLEAEE